MAFLEENCFGSIGCEFGADKGNNDFNDSRPTSFSQRSWLDFNKNEQPKDKFDSTRTPLDDTVRQVHVTQLSVSLDIAVSALVMECLPRTLTTSIWCMYRASPYQHLQLPKIYF